MTILDKLEKKFGRLRLPNLIYVFVGAFVFGYLLDYVAPSVLMYLCFSPADILRGQVWRLFTYIVMMPGSGNIFLTFITCFIFISIANSLERIIGRFRLNAFLVIGWFMMIIAGFLFYYLMPDEYSVFATYLNPYYVLAMLFVLFAMIFPDAQFLLMFIIPVRGRWMVYITFALYLLEVFRAFRIGVFGYGWMLVFMIIGAVLSLILFLYLNGYRRRRRNAHTVNIRAFRKNSREQDRQQAKTARHKCAVCGRTELTNPELDFRYCSKCAGNYEYCSEHLYTHVHRTVPDGTQKQ